MTKLTFMGLIFSLFFATSAWAGHHEEGMDKGKCGPKQQCKAMKGKEKLDCRKKKFSCHYDLMTKRVEKISSKKKADKKSKAKAKFSERISKKIQKTQERMGEVEQNLAFMKDKLSKLNEIKSKVNSL